MKFYLKMMSGDVYEIVKDSYEAFERDMNDQEMLFHTFRSVQGIIHTVAKMGILSVAVDSGVKLPSIQL